MTDTKQLEEQLTEIYSNAADKVAPKQKNGSIERKVALGMMAETLMPIIELITAAEAAAERRGRKIQAEATLDKWQSIEDDSEITEFLKGQVEAWRFELQRLQNQTGGSDEHR